MQHERRVIFVGAGPIGASVLALTCEDSAVALVHAKAALSNDEPIAASPRTELGHSL